MSDRVPVPRNLTEFLRGFRDRTPDPGDEAAAKDIARCWGCSIEEATQRLGVIFQTRSQVESYIGREIGDESSIRLLFNHLSVDFGLLAFEVDRLHPCHLILLLNHLQRWKQWDASERQILLKHIASNREAETTSSPIDPISSRIFLKALDRFPDPDPEASEVATSQPPRHEATTSAVPDPAANEAPDRPAAKKGRRKRDEGKAERCVGIYMDAITRKLTPPTPSELAKQVGCDPGTASRAIAAWEATRMELAKDDAKSRYRHAD